MVRHVRVQQAAERVADSPGVRARRTQLAIDERAGGGGIEVDPTRRQVEAVDLRGAAGRDQHHIAVQRLDLAVGALELELDDDSHAGHRAGQPVELSPTEFKLSRFLLENAGRVLTK